MSRDILGVEAVTPSYIQYASSVPDQPGVRKVAPRGKSMEELGVSEISRAKALSKSSEHLHQLHKRHIMSERERKEASFLMQQQEHPQRKLQQQFTHPIGNEQNAQAGHVRSVSKDLCLDHLSAVLPSQTLPCATTSAPSDVYSNVSSPGGRILPNPYGSNNDIKDALALGTCNGTSDTGHVRYKRRYYIL